MAVESPLRLDPRPTLAILVTAVLIPQARLDLPFRNRTRATCGCSANRRGLLAALWFVGASLGAVPALGATAAGTALSAENVTETTATLRLDGHTGYWTYKEGLDNSVGGCTHVPAPNTTADLTGLEAGHGYTYLAFSSPTCGPDEELARHSFHTLPSAAPPMPTTPTVAAGVGQVTLSASISGDYGAITGWEYAYKTDGSFGSWTAFQGDSAAYSLDHAVTGLIPCTAHVFKVRAVNAKGGGTASDESESVTPSGKPAKPTAVTVSHGDASVTLSWTAGSNCGSAITGWEYAYKTEGGYGSWTAVPNGGAGTTSHTVTELTNGIAHRFKVRAVNANGDGAASDESASVTPSTTPGKPTGLTAAKGNASVGLSWTAGGNGGSAITGWKYAYMTDGDYGGWKAVPGSSADTTSYTVPNLTNGTAHRFKVLAVNINGDGAESDESASVTPQAPPATLAASKVQATTATLTIGEHTDAWHHKHTKPLLPEGACSAEIAAGTKTADLANLLTGTTYSFSAYEDGTCTTLLATAPDFTTKPGQVSGLQVGPGGATSLAVSWTAEGGTAAVSYKVQWKSGNEDWDAAARQATSTEASKTLTGLTEGTQYAVRVGAVNVTGDGAWSAEATGAPSDVTLAAEDVTATGATLRIAGHDLQWSFRQTGSTDSTDCVNVPAGITVATLSNLQAGASHSYDAWSVADCAGAVLVTVAFSTAAETGGTDTGGGGGGGGSAPRTPEVRPEVTALTLGSDPGPDFRYESGDEIIVEATFSEPVRAFNDNLKLGLSIGGEARTAEYVGGSETKTLRFRYVVGPEDRDLDGIGFPADGLKDNFGRIHSLGGLASPLDIGEDAIPVTTGHRVGPPPSVPLLPAANDAAGRQGFVRVINHSAEPGEISITAFDDAGTRFGPVTLAIGASAAAHLNASDLEAGNEAKGLSGGTGPGQGDWRLEFEGAPAVEAIGYVRHSDGFLTAVQDVAPRSGGVHRVATFNPASNHRQLSRLRIVNLGQETASVSVTGEDDAGRSPGEAVALSLPAGAAEVWDAPALESGTGLAGGLGDGEGKWRLSAAADGPVEVMSLLESPSGHLTNLSAAPSIRHGNALVAPLFLSATDPHQRQGFVRIINRSDKAGRVYIKAHDDSGRDHPQMELRIDANAAVHLNSDDLEVGNRHKGLRGSTGPASSGDWMLELTSGLDIEALAYVRHKDGFLTSMHDAAPVRDGLHRVATFNPASNYRQVSLLRIVNLGDVAARVTIKGIDGNGKSPGSQIEVSVPAHRSVTLASKALEEGGDGFTGALGAGASKWRLQVGSEQPILVMSLMQSPTGHLTNLSARPLQAD